MSGWKARLALTAQRNRQEIVKAQLSRREMARLGLLTAGGALVAKSGLSSRAFAGGGDAPASPPTKPWSQPLPLLQIKQPVAASALSGGAPDGTTVIEHANERVKHQLWDKFPPKKFYEITMRETQIKLDPSYSPTTYWGFDGTVPGPMIQARYGEPVMVRWHNHLPSVKKPQNFGIAEMAPHLHNAHTASESDGFPEDYFNSINDPKPLNPKGFKDCHYPNVYAGYTARGDLVGDPAEALSTLWYHDHHHDFTAQNVYKGMFGAYNLFDDKDTGDEGTGLRLPSGPYDQQLFLGDPLLDRDCQLVFDLFNLDGILGDKYAVNGAIQPFFEVKKRRYRLRIVVPGPSRFYQVALFDGKDFLPFWQISSDGTLLPEAVQVTSLNLAVAERADIIVDFSKIAASKLYLVNRMEQVDGRGPTGKILTPGASVLEFRVGDKAQDNSRDPSTGGAYKLRELPDPDMSALLARAAKANTRTWEFTRGNGAWSVNGEAYDANVVSAKIPQESEEVWVIQNGGGGWAHPIHVHFEEGRVLSRDGVQVKPGVQIDGTINYARKDVYTVGDNKEARVFFRFRDMKGRYVMHCHNVVHEDHGMMVRWEIV